MRIVLDTNVLVDGFADDLSAQARFIDAVINDEIIAVSTPAVNHEYQNILRRLIDNPAYHAQMEEFLSRLEIVKPARVDEVVIDDAEDYKILQAAVGGNADLVVSSDRHLLDIGEIDSIRIMPPAEAWVHYEEEEQDGGSSWQNFVKGIGIGCLLVGMLLVSPSARAEVKNPVNEALQKLETNTQAIADKQAEIDQIEAKIRALNEKRDTTAAEAEIIDNQIQRLTTQLDKAELELKQTKLNIQSVRTQQQETEQTVGQLQQQVEATRTQLRRLIQVLHEREQESLVRVWFTSFSLSEVLAQRTAYQDLQQRAIQTVQQLRTHEDELKQKQEELEAQEQDLRSFHDLLVGQENELAAQRAEQHQFLSAKRSQQLTYEHLLADAAAARAEIERQVFTLKNTGVELSLHQALDMARLAGKLTGVRPALLLGVLKVESNLGEQVGGGHFPDDMHPASRDAFVRLTKKLGLDPATAPISARPRSYHGWGGAMGPGQIMPDTWERIESRVGALMGKAQPNPYELTDAFVATALFLADKGAASPAQEYEAVNRYLAGPNWQRFTWYGDRVLAVAKEYAAQGL